MKEEKFLNNLNRIIGEDEVSPLINDEIEIPIPKRIRDMVAQAQTNLKREKNQAKSPGILDTLADFINPATSTPTVSFGMDGTEEEEQEDDPLADLLKKDKEDTEKDNEEE